MKKNVGSWLLLLFKGMLVGFGAILPGVSGGTLCAAFGMYEPVMNLMAHPINEVRKSGLCLLFFVSGAVFGFVGLAGAAAWLMELDCFAVIFVFVGLICGTLPELWSNAGKHGRGKGTYASLAVSFVLLSAVLWLLGRGGSVELEPDFKAYLLCGLLWGLSFTVPGLSSSTLIMFFGLYESMLDGISSFAPEVILPIAVGIALCFLLLPRLTQAAFSRHYAALSHGVIGIVLASTLAVIPFGEILTVRSGVIAFAYAAVGLAAARAFAAIERKISK